MVFCDECRALLLQRHAADEQRPSFPRKMPVLFEEWPPNTMRGFPTVPMSAAEEAEASRGASDPAELFSAAPLLFEEGWPLLRGIDDPPQVEALPIDGAAPARRTPGEELELSEVAACAGGGMGLAPDRRPKPVKPPRARRLRWLFLLLTMLALLLIIFNGLLMRSGFSHLHQQTVSMEQPPFLTAAPAVVYAGQTVHLHLDHFPAFAQVYVSHDVGQALAPAGMSALIRLGASGSTDVSVVIGRDWNPGSHTIQAEDINSHYTASAALQVLAAGPLRPPALEIDQRSLNMGAAAEGANSALPLSLRNGGDGAISWTASSDQPWLSATPAQGVLSDHQTILVAVSRANLRPGSYHATLTLTSDAGSPQHVQVEMQVLTASLPVPLLELTPPALSFSMTDDGPDPASQFVLLTNPGSRPAGWSIRTVVPPVAEQDQPLPAVASWLQVSPMHGTLAPGAQASLEVTAHGRHLLPGLYLLELVLGDSRVSLDTPQLFVASLTVLPSCRLALSLQNLSFSTAPGHAALTSQEIDLGLVAGCATSVSWQAFTSASWLSVNPASGRVAASGSSRVLVSVDPDALGVGSYSGFVLFSTSQRTQTVAVQLNVLASVTVLPGGGSVTTPAQAQGMSTLGAVLSPTSLSFTAQQKGPAPPPRSVSLTATSQPLVWSLSFNGSSYPWLQVSPASGTLAAGETARIAVSVQTQGLTSGSYAAQLVLMVAPVSSPGNAVAQALTVSLTLLAPCVLEVTPTSLTFSAPLLQPDPPPQTLMLLADGGCQRPLSWSAVVDSGSLSWLHLTQTSGSDSGSGSVITVYVTPPRLLLKALHGQITITAVDRTQSALQSSPQVIAVTVSPS